MQNLFVRTFVKWSNHRILMVKEIFSLTPSFSRGATGNQIQQWSRAKLVTKPVTWNPYSWGIDFIKNHISKTRIMRAGILLHAGLCYMICISYFF